jgi:hypothetical protein
MRYFVKQPSDAGSYKGTANYDVSVAEAERRCAVGQCSVYLARVHNYICLTRTLYVGFDCFLRLVT